MHKTAEAIREQAGHIARIHPEFATPALYAELQRMSANLLRTCAQLIDDIADSKERIDGGRRNQKCGDSDRVGANPD